MTNSMGFFVGVGVDVGSNIYPTDIYPDQIVLCGEVGVVVISCT